MTWIPSHDFQRPSCAGDNRRTRALLLLLTCLLVAGSGCRTTASTLLVVEGAAGPREIHPWDLQREEGRSLVAEVRKVRLTVHHRPEQQDVAQEALAKLRAAVEFVGSILDAEAEFEIQVYLAPLSSDEELASFNSFGKVLTLILMLPEASPGRGLFETEFNAELLCELAPHELTHVFQAKRGVFVADGWLGEGIPEYLAERFLQRHCGSSLPLMRIAQPPLVALQRVEIEAWKNYKSVPGTPWGRFRKWLEARRERKRKLQDPAAVRLERIELAWKYAAAGPLVERLLQAAVGRGSDEPFQELLAQIDAHELVGWDESEEIALAMTGRTLPQLAEVTEEERNHAREQAWKDRAHEHPRVRLRALATLRYLGLPEEAEAGDLLASLELPTGVHPTHRRAQQLLQAATGAVAAAGEPSVAEHAVDLLDDGSVELHRIVAPELWELFAEAGHPQEALAQLEATLGDGAVDPEEQQRAAATLERLSDDRSSRYGESADTRHLLDRRDQ